MCQCTPAGLLTSFKTDTRGLDRPPDTGDGDTLHLCHLGHHHRGAVTDEFGGLAVTPGSCVPHTSGSPVKFIYTGTVSLREPVSDGAGKLQQVCGVLDHGAAIKRRSKGEGKARGRETGQRSLVVGGFC